MSISELDVFVAGFGVYVAGLFAESITIVTCFDGVFFCMYDGICNVAESFYCFLWHSNICFCSQHNVFVATT